MSGPGRSGQAGHLASSALIRRKLRAVIVTRTSVVTTGSNANDVGSFEPVPHVIRRFRTGSKPRGVRQATSTAAGSADVPSTTKFAVTAPNRWGDGHARDTQSRARGRLTAGRVAVACLT